MKQILLIFLGVAIILSISSCDYFELEDIEGLTTDEIVEGLKEALVIGTDSAVSCLAVENGYYYGDVINVKIPLPEEAEQIRTIINKYNTLSDLIDLDSYFEDVIKAVNWAAESAADSAAPIFWDAITNLSILDGTSILNGHNPYSSSLDYDSTAATQYFKVETTSALTNLYSPFINNALDEDLGLGFSAVEAWNTLTSKYNSLRSSWAVTLALAALSDIDLPEEINDDLGEFCTEKALDGLFYMVGEEEKEIRKDPFQWASDIIQNVFGSLFDE